ncbi:HAD hydrolase family protein [Flammeovirga yaeyamensis]|uniref:N-acylneuraminate cytidylyltransferase n=1 Tax=Flammeovirga yaeyamensis TaxID=367791 RepID=A0AAX1N973_9BACT|nr:N-acylneuraminate cytidylyltransferase [Flammeovirga yaeyamensis]MBB3699811.1 N-acylneuraminate cytidylyltransferase [Flammeovirga yaeyamensis]NMF36620.1 N-acylneuraminate cytidylyltransferase [Flammeovirga yaeyamensis]QWG02333.1 HAD hydrolase family protein [Flammeovirga yaeyamensis]
MKKIAFIPVRGGSKSIPKKNIKSFCGKPLVYWTALAAQESSSIDEVIIATDSDEIKEVVEQFNFSKLKVYGRSEKNAQDQSSTESVILEYLEKNNEIKDTDQFILIQATSPFLSSLDLTNGINKLKESGKDSLLSCSQVKRFFWSGEGVPLNYDYNNRPRRQDFDGTYIENGAFYINSVGNIKKHKNRLSGNICVYEMPEYTMTEIDEPDDWFIAEHLMKKYSSDILQSIPLENKEGVKLFLSDVDGVLTDAGMYYSESGDELKKFNTHDGMAFQLLSEQGIKTGIVTSENTKIVERRAKKMKIDFLYQGKKHGGKLNSAKEICKELGISLQEVAYIGDDINCFELLSSVGLAACPSNATDKIKNIPNIIQLEKAGGEGAVREFVNKII